MELSPKFSQTYFSLQNSLSGAAEQIVCCVVWSYFAFASFNEERRCSCCRGGGHGTEGHWKGWGHLEYLISMQLVMWSLHWTLLPYQSHWELSSSSPILWARKVRIRMVNSVWSRGGCGLPRHTPASVPRSVRHRTPPNTGLAEGHLLFFSLKKKIGSVLSFWVAYFRLSSLGMPGEAHWLKWPTLARHHSNHLHELFYNRRSW